MNLTVIYLIIARYQKRYTSPRTFVPNYRKNEGITVEKVLLVGDDGEKFGEIDTKKAMEMAEEQGLDLIEVSPNSKPPVAKIMSWSKFKYEQEKKKKDQKTKSSSLKEMWFKPFIGDKDLEHKLKKVKEFIKKKNSVKLTIRARGRVQRSHLSDLMDKILKIIEEYAEPQDRPKFQGRNLGTIAIPRKTKLVHEETQDKQNEDITEEKLDQTEEEIAENTTEETLGVDKSEKK